MADFKKTTKQDQATLLHSSDATNIMLFGGSRSGKTFISVRNIIIRALKCQSRHVILRLRFNHVKTSVWYDTFPKVMKICFPECPHKPNKADWFVEFENGSQIWFAGLDDKERVEKILGNEYSTVYLNECSQISWESVGMVMTRLAEKTELQNKIYYDCNPPSTKHWTYKRFILQEDPITGEKIDNGQYKSLLMNPRDNTDNLPDNYIESILSSLSKKQRLRFELGQFINDVDGALWDQDMLILAQSLEYPEVKERVVAVDPAVTNNEDSDLTGIVVASTDGERGAVEADYSLKASPNQWAQTVVDAYYNHDADSIVVEVNQGGDLVEAIIRKIPGGERLKIHKVRASKGKFARAEPIAALYERGLIHHVSGLDKLETELTEYVPMNSKKSPDRLDAMVWGLTHLLIGKKRRTRVVVI